MEREFETGQPEPGDCVPVRLFDVVGLDLEQDFAVQVLGGSRAGALDLGEEA
jgi:hypothetical protein